MFQDVIVAALFRTFHARVDDALLDRAAREAGCRSGIGRLSLLSDAMTERVIAMLLPERIGTLLDLGCGRGFLGRWLRRCGGACEYIGVDRIPEALAAARVASGDDARCTFVESDYRTFRANEPVDAIAALEVTGDGAIDTPLLDALAANLREGGRFVVSAASLDGGHAERRRAGEAALRARFARVEIVDETVHAAAFAQRLYGALLAIDGWDATIAPRMAAQAEEVLDAIARGRFAYALASGTA